MCGQGRGIPRIWGLFVRVLSWCLRAELRTVLSAVPGVVHRHIAIVFLALGGFATHQLDPPVPEQGRGQSCGHLLALGFKEPVFLPDNEFTAISAAAKARTSLDNLAPTLGADTDGREILSLGKGILRERRISGEGAENDRVIGAIAVLLFTSGQMGLVIPQHFRDHFSRHLLAHGGEEGVLLQNGKEVLGYILQAVH